MSSILSLIRIEDVAENINDGPLDLVEVVRSWRYYNTIRCRYLAMKAERLQNFWWRIWASEMNGATAAKLYLDISNGNSFVPLGRLVHRATPHSILKKTEGPSRTEPQNPHFLSSSESETETNINSSIRYQPPLSHSQSSNVAIKAKRGRKKKSRFFVARTTRKSKPAIKRQSFQPTNTMARVSTQNHIQISAKNQNQASQKISNGEVLLMQKVNFLYPQGSQKEGKLQLSNRTIPQESSTKNEEENT